MKEPLFRSLTEEECFKQYGFSKEDMEELYNEGKPICSALHSKQKEAKK
jgi:regulator of replication initiation timing